MPSPPVPLPESVGPFTVRGLLGRGAMGIVYDALDLHGRPVALKLLHPSPMQRPKALVARFEREARILAELDHPGIVRLLDWGEADGAPYLAMERVDGVSLLALRRRQALELEPLVEIAQRLALALAYVHEKGVVHRDIKPANVLVRPDGRPVLTDFGISAKAEATGITRFGDLLGSPGFMAPEVVRGQPHDPASDQFALGRLLFELGARGPSPRLPRDLPLLELLDRALDMDWRRFPIGPGWASLTPLLERMVSVEPAARFPSMLEASDALQAIREPPGPASLLAELERLDMPSDPNEAQPLPEDAFISLLGEPDGTLADSNFPTPAEGTVYDLRPNEPEPADRPRLRLPPLGGRPTPVEPPAPVRAAPVPPPVSHPEPRPPQVVSAPAPPTLEHVPRPSALRIEGLEPPRGPSDEDRRRVLEAQVQRLREELDALRIERRPPPPKTKGVGVVVAAVLALAAGLGLGRLGAPTAAPPPLELLLLPDGQPPAAFAVEAGPRPSDREVADATTLLEFAREKLRQRDLAGAELLLERCADLARLPRCYRLRAALRSVLQDPAAFDSLRRYLRHAPASEETERLRRALEHGFR